MAKVVLQQLCKTYPNGVPAVCDVELEVADGEFMVLVGPSGCGKTTTLRMIAGLETVTNGELYIGDRNVNEVPPGERNVSMVFQNYALYPHMTVFQNISFGLKARKVSKATIRLKVSKAAAKLGLEDLLKRKPGELSGGQRQRVALGRAMVREPDVFLLDEPLSNLDAKMRTAMRRELALLQRELKATMIYVTHDQSEAMTLGDRICVMQEGRIQQVGPPMDVYDRPANAFVAGFLGNPPMNLLDGKEVGGDPQGARLGVRPEKLKLGPARDSSALELQGVLDMVEQTGDSRILFLKTQAGTVAVRVQDGDYAPGMRLTCHAAKEDLHLFPSHESTDPH